MENTWFSIRLIATRGLFEIRRFGQPIWSCLTLSLRLTPGFAIRFFLSFSFTSWFIIFFGLSFSLFFFCGFFFAGFAAFIRARFSFPFALANFSLFGSSNQKPLTMRGYR